MPGAGTCTGIHVGMSGQIVEVEVLVLHILAVVALRTGQAKDALF